LSTKQRDCLFLSIQLKIRPKKPGAINGGFFRKSDDKPAQYPSVVIYAEDIKEHLKKVKKSAAMTIYECNGYMANLPKEQSKTYLVKRQTEGFIH
jgi:hypothetical protein